MSADDAPPTLTPSLDLPPAPPLPGSADVVVIGAGLAGLAAALHLQRAGHHVVVVEASDAVGGRIRTDVVDGFRFDRGFQLYNPAYPEGQRMLDHDRLDLKGFERGAIISTSNGSTRLGDPRSHPTWAVDAVKADLGGPVGLARFAGYATRCAITPPHKLRERPDVTIRTALTDAGVPPQLFTRLITPFLSGVFLESQLDTSRRFADLILRSFVRGTPAVPAGGMQAIPTQLAGKLAHVHLGTPATRIHGGLVETVAGTVRAAATVVASGPAQVATLLPEFPTPATHSCTTWYHAPDQPASQLAAGLAILTIDGDGTGPVVNTAVMSNAAPSYSPPGASLVSSTALGLASDVSESTVRAQLARMYRIDTSGWTHLATYEVPDALPDMASPTRLQRPVDVGGGVFLAGDHRDTASIQGALVSGRRAATAVHRHLLSR